MEPVKNPELQLAFDFVQYTNRNIFLTGKAGTGKTTFLHNLKKTSPKRMIVLAPTGVAAINAGGVTIHSFFQLPFHPHIPSQYISAANAVQSPIESFKLGREKVNIIKSLDLLIIDEISMVRADLLDAIDLVLRRFKDRNRPFGGVQLLMIGDIQQLAPVTKEEDWAILGKYYNTAFFFGSYALSSADYVTIELKHIYRQQDEKFIKLLNKVRDNQIDNLTLAELNKRYDPARVSVITEGYITLTTHNSQAQSINNSQLDKLTTPPHTFKAIIKEDFPEYIYPNALELTLKKGAQVMFIKNDISKDKLFFNGKIGKVVDFENNRIIVKCPDNGNSIKVEMAEWDNMKYTLNEETKEIQETVIGTFIQYPLKPAWAITIHKSQGLTFDKAIIDAKAAFAHGQVYVALSRCRTLDGLILSTPVSQRGIISDSAVNDFIKDSEHRQPDEKHLTDSKRSYQLTLITELFNFNTLLKNLYYSLKILNEHKQNLLGTPGNAVEKIIGDIKTHLAEVSEKFQPQITKLLCANPDAEANQILQDRIIKACEYFKDKISNLVAEPVQHITIETDNKTIRKSVNDAFNKVKEELSVKLSCLDVSKSGFNIKTYLEAKAKASIEIPGPKKHKEKPMQDFDGSIAYPALYNRLTLWRNNKAKSLNVPNFMILPLETIALLVNRLPQSSEALKQIKGMGKKKLEKFGIEIIALITEYCSDHNIHAASSFIKESTPVKKNSDTKEISYNLYKEGKSIVQIAADRKMSVNTIEGHLGHYVGTGDLPLDDFVSPETTDLIKSKFDAEGSNKMSPVKAALGDKVSWSEIKFVIKHLEFMESQRTY